MALDIRPARRDLTSRECAKIIGGVLGAIVQMVPDLETLREAVRWWAETDAAWTGLAKVKQFFGGEE